MLKTETAALKFWYVAITYILAKTGLYELSDYILKDEIQTRQCFNDQGDNN